MLVVRTVLQRATEAEVSGRGVVVVVELVDKKL